MACISIELNIANIYNCAYIARINFNRKELQVYMVILNFESV